MYFIANIVVLELFGLVTRVQYKYYEQRKMNKNDFKYTVYTEIVKVVTVQSYFSFLHVKAIIPLFISRFNLFRIPYRNML